MAQLNYLDRENLRLKLQWLNRWHSGFTGVPMWEPIAQEWFDRNLRLKRIRAMDYLMLRRKGNVVQFRRYK